MYQLVALMCLDLKSTYMKYTRQKKSKEVTAIDISLLIDIGLFDVLQFSDLLLKFLGVKEAIKHKVET